MSLRFMTAGESHGQALIGILEGMPAGVPIDIDHINTHLYRRQIGIGRGFRMRIEKDVVEILSGIRSGKTLGSPITLMIRNRDWENWKHIMTPLVEESSSDRPRREITEPRPGHADLAGGIKYHHTDLRNTLERASARETAVRVALGALTLQFLNHFHIKVYGHIRQVGPVTIPDDFIPAETDFQNIEPETFYELPCLIEDVRENMKTLIDETQKRGDTLGGVVELLAFHVPPGLGSYVHWDRRIDGALARMFLSIPSVKGVCIGPAVDMAGRFGSEVHDEIEWDEHNQKFVRKTNNAGGIEGGVTNGEPILVRVFVKPIPTLRQPLKTVNIRTYESTLAHYERSDTTAIAPMVVIGEACMGLILAQFFLEMFSGGHLYDVKKAYSAYCERLKTYPEFPE